MKRTPLIVADTDHTADQIARTLAYTAGISYADFDRLAPDARHQYDALADYTIRQLRLLSVAHDHYGIPEPTFEAALAEKRRAEETVDFNREQHQRNVAELKEAHQRRIDDLVRSSEKALTVLGRVERARHKGRKMVRIADLLEGLGGEVR